MVVEEEFQGKESFKCEECGFHYENRDREQECEEFCQEKGSCSFDITTDSLERKAIT